MACDAGHMQAVVRYVPGTCSCIATGSLRLLVAQALQGSVTVRPVLLDLYPELDMYRAAETAAQFESSSTTHLFQDITAFTNRHTFLAVSFHPDYGMDREPLFILRILLDLNG